MLGELTGSQVGYIGGILGCIFGFAGGTIGTYFSIKNTNGPLEKRFMVQVSAVTWISVLIFLGLLTALPSPYRFLIWIPYGILLPLSINHINKKQQKIRAMEASSD